MEELIKGKSISEYIEQNIIFSELNEYRYLWSIILYSGYLSAAEINYRIYLLNLPNKEIKRLYEDILEGCANA